MPDVTVQAGPEFPAGTSVGAYRQTGDLWPGAAPGDAVKTAKSDGVHVVFKGLPEGRYWAAGESGHKSFVSKVVPEAKVMQPPRQAHDPSLVGGAAKERRIITGARGSKVFSSGQVAESVPEEHEVAPKPHVNQTSAGDVAQRSSTVLGQATPVDVEPVKKAAVRRKPAAKKATPKKK